MPRPGYINYLLTYSVIFIVLVTDCFHTLVDSCSMLTQALCLFMEVLTAMNVVLDLCMNGVLYLCNKLSFILLFCSFDVFSATVNPCFMLHGLVSTEPYCPGQSCH